MRSTYTMLKVIQYFPFFVLVLSALTIPSAEAHSPGVVLVGVGTATIDGQLGPGEWNSAAKINFLANLPLSDGGGATPATLFIMNDGANLYLAVKVLRTQLNTGDLGFGLDQAAFEFDNNHNGGAGEEGDDVLLVSPGFNYLGVSTFFDEVRTTRPPCPSGVGLCGFLDVELTSPGTNDGAGAATNNGTFSFFEMSHPLDSADDFNDFSIAPGSIVGFHLQLNLSSAIVNCSSDCSASTILPPSGGRGDIVIALPIGIDVRPGGPNNINPNSQAKLQVAILTTSTFDATSVDPNTVRLGRSGTEAALTRYSLEDFDQDGDVDMLVQFDTKDTGIQCGDPSVSLKAQRFGGQIIGGSDSINTVGCR